MPQANRWPRNAQAIVDARRDGTLAAGASFVVSFVDRTPLDMLHVYPVQGRKHDWRFAAGLHANIVVRVGVDVGNVFGDLFALTVLYPNVIDFDRKQLASLVEGAHGLKLWPVRRGSAPWLELFAE